MTQLTRTAALARGAIKFGLIGLVVLMVGRVAVSNGYKLYKHLFPDPPPPPTLGFGILPEVVFPESSYSLPALKLETPDGGFPPTPPTAKVFEVITSRPNLLALERSTEQAMELGFANQPIALNESLYRWSRPDPLPAILEIEIYEGTYSMSVNWSRDNTFLQNNQLQSEAQAITSARDFLSRSGLLPQDMSLGSETITYLTARGGDYTQTVSLSEADFVDVDLFRDKIDAQFPVVTPAEDRGVIEVIISGNRRYASGIVKIVSGYFPIDYLSPQTYPIKPAAQAWEEMQQGRGYVASSPETIEQVSVRRIELGYFDSLEPQPYLQPIWIFSGDNNFIAYASAVQSVYGQSQ